MTGRLFKPPPKNNFFDPKKLSKYKGEQCGVPLTKHPSLPPFTSLGKKREQGGGTQLSRVELLIIKHIPIT
jgi:hypothetical protein